MMDFGYLLDNSARITWKYKFLWLFSILASCAGVPSFNYSTSYNSSFDPSNPDSIPPEALKIAEFIEKMIIESPELFAGMILAAILVGIAVHLFLFMIRSTGRAGLIQGIFQASSNVGGMTFGSVFQASKDSIWKLAVLSFTVWLLVALATFAAFFAFMFFLVQTAQITNPNIGFGFIVFFCCFICIFYLVIGFISMIVSQAHTAIVVERVSAWEGWKRGWRVIREHLGSYLFLGAMVLVAAIILSIIFAIPSVILINIFIDPRQMNTINPLAPWENPGYRYLLLFSALMIPVGLAIQGILGTFLKSIWTLAYIRNSMPPTNSSEPVHEPEPLPDSL